MVEEAIDSDVSIPYDSAARLAYDQWRAQYNKGNFDASRYQNFKNNYEAITVANVIAKKRARDEGTVSISLMTLNEFGDLSEVEYKLATQASSSSSLPTSTGDVLSKALEAAELQVQASTALGEAADALAEEEQVRNSEFKFYLILNNEERCSFHTSH
jgi:Cathepsin propeptide inhibitor domain (I29)